MHKFNLAMMLIRSLFIFVLFSIGTIYGQEWQTPVIQGYGEVKYFDKAAVQPNPKAAYKLLFDIKSTAEKSGVNKGLWVMARMLNLLSLAKVPSENINLVASIHGDATYITLNDTAYREKFGKPNPNLNIITQLKENGVNLFVCSQATAAREITAEKIHPNVTPAISGLSVLASYQMKGFILMP